MHGFCHLEIPSKDFERSKNFYGKIFGWKFEEMQGMDYMLFMPPDGMGGGFTKSSEPSTKPGFLPYIEVVDIQATLDTVESMGGGKVIDKTIISPEQGFFAIFNDPDGNRLGLWSKK